MTEAAPLASSSIVPIFASPFAVLSLPEAGPHNESITASLQMRAAADPDPLADCSELYYHSRENALLDDAPSRALVSLMSNAVRQVALEVNEVSIEDMRSWTIQTSVSFAVIRSNGSMPPRNFPMTSWCAIYCVEAPSSSSERRDSGVLRLYEGRMGNVFADATNTAMRVPYATGHYAWRPAPGQMAVFPGSITHGVALVRSSGRMVLVTLRARFVAPGQSGWAIW